ncbi:uncharacterized protein LOC143788826 [Ranitomeya variabilis]|uniref:uncharacterized protein LOC143788826 n=1 Tax=Ranitomeya variabilis TaxID=490064 RepID=UPI004055C19B
MDSQNFLDFPDQVEDSVLDEFIRGLPESVFNTCSAPTVDGVPSLGCDTAGAEFNIADETDAWAFNIADEAGAWAFNTADEAGAWAFNIADEADARDSAPDIIDVDLIPEPDTPEHNQMLVEDPTYQAPTPRNSPVSRAPKKPRGAASKKGKACKLKPRRVFTKENIHLLAENPTEAPEAATAGIHPISLDPKSKVMRKIHPTPLQPLQLTENGAVPVWPSIQPSITRVNDPTLLYPEVVEVPRKHNRKTKHITDPVNTTSAAGAAATLSREELDREIDQLADGKRSAVEPIIIRMSHTMHPPAAYLTAPANTSGAVPTGASNLGSTSHACVSNSVNAKKGLKRALPASAKLCKKTRIQAPATNLPHESSNEFIRGLPESVFNTCSAPTVDGVPSLGCDTAGAEFNIADETDAWAFNIADEAGAWAFNTADEAGAWAFNIADEADARDSAPDIIDVDLIPEPDTPEHNQMLVEDPTYQAPTPRNSPVSRAPKKPRGAASKKGKACKLKPRRVFTKENIHLLAENPTEAPEAATAGIHPISLDPKSKVMRKIHPTPLQPLQLTENGAVPVWPSIQPSITRVNDPTLLYPEVVEVPRKHNRKTKHITDPVNTTSAAGAAATLSREELDREIDQLADGKRSAVEPIIIRMSHTMHPPAAYLTAPANTSGAVPTGASNLGSTSHACVSNSVNAKKGLKRALPASAKLCKKTRIQAPATNLPHESSSWGLAEMAACISVFDA